MKPCDAVFFDLDGTLLDTLEDLWAAVNATMRQFGCPERTLGEVRQAVGNGVNRLLELVLPAGREDPRFDEIVRFYRAYYAEHAEIATRPYPGLPSLLSELKARGIPTAVVSNKPDATTVRLCAEFFPDASLAVGENEAAGIRRKPAPDMVLHAAGTLGVDPSSCVYVGDSEVDLETARAAGMPCVSVLWGFRDRDTLASAGATRFARDAGELAAILLGSGERFD